MEISGSPVPPDHLDVKVSLILACASLAAVNLDAAKAQELGIASINIDAFARDLWRKAMVLTTHLDLDSDCSTTCLEAVMSALPKTQPSLADSHANSTTTRASDSILLLRVVAIKLLLLLAARSFAAPSEYLKLHLDTISSAVDASLDSPGDDDMPLEEREWRWQLWSYLCVLDWTSPGIYHNGSYFIRPEMHSEPPSMVPRLPDDGKPTPPAEKDHWERLSQTGYFLKYALALACLSRKAEDCIIRPGPISPVQAAELCSELDALEHKLSFYQLLGAGAGRGGESSGPNHSVSGSVSGGGTGGGTCNGSGGSPGLDEHRVSLQDALQVQHVHLGLELGLIRFKVFRHEAFHLMHDATTSGQLRMMCMDACMDACTFVLSQCIYIGGTNQGAEGMQSTMTMDLANGANCGEKRPYPRVFRRVIQPASSAALVGQVLLHASQSADGLGLLIPPDTHTTNTPVPVSHAGTNSSINGNNSATDFLSPCAMERSMRNFGLQHCSANDNGNGGGASWTGRFRPEKVSILEWHVNTVITELEALRSTSALARNKLTLHRQCM
ncbi:MAG: hypothetical protein LQ338_000733 [Usnochroma carphineum]|nr:MAG: hypothetical protein LQ338_000733 [Usnochroma carphineum]